ncbi:MAG: monofunctional biosynthetic peptidoglycan transglycosylase [Rhodothermales bacterium]|nr:monofunctional biosynthetic peptidoglycan transglycosylase [Rhodothermales bacterium]
MRRFFGGIAAVLASGLAAYFGVCALCLLLLNVVYPPTTGVQMQRRVESWIEGRAYEKHYAPVPRAALSKHLRHAVVAAEDGRFYEHGGIDWQAVEKAIEDNRRRGRAWRGGSTITQQLVKNLFLTTHSNYVRKALEVPLTYLAELLLPKERILDLYLNVVEFDDGVFGAEAAAQRYFGTSAARLSRYQAAGLAAVLPAPRRRSPQQMGRYTNVIVRRMSQMGW